MNSNMSIQSSQDSEMVVLAKYKTINERQTKRIFEFRIELIIEDLFNFFANPIMRYFTREVETKKAILHYTKIVSVTEDGIKQLEELPQNIVLFISKEDKAHG